MNESVVPVKSDGGGSLIVPAIQHTVRGCQHRGKNELNTYLEANWEIGCHRATQALSYL